MPPAPGPRLGRAAPPARSFLNLVTPEQRGPPLSRNLTNKPLTGKSPIECAVKRRRTPVGEQTHPAIVAPAGSSRGGPGRDERSEALGAKGPVSGSASQQAVMQMNIEQVPKPSNVDADPAQSWGRLPSDMKRAKRAVSESTGVLMTACWQEEFCGNTGNPARCLGSPGHLPPARAGQGRVGWRRGPYDRRSRVTLAEERGLGSRTMQEEAKARRLA